MALEVASLFATLGVRDDLTPALDRAEQRTRSFADRLQSIGGSLTNLGGNITALTAPIAAFFGTGIRTASNFEAIMSEIAARTGLAADEMDRVRQFSLQMGAATAFSSQQAAEAFLKLLSTGQSVSEAFQTLPVVLDAAAASGEDLGRTADLVTDIMAAFGLPVDQARTVVDALARAASSSSASMADLGQGFRNVGNVARSFGLSVDETAAILAIFSENGIKGAEAGTQLRSMLLNMSRTTPEVQAAWERLGTSLYDARGQMRPLADVMDDIAQATANMSDAERNEVMIKLAGSYGILGLSALTGSMSIREMQAAMASQTDAATIAAQRMDTFKGRMDSLAGSIETLQITAITPLIEQALKPLVEQAIEVVNSITAWVNENPELAMTIVQVGAALAVLGPLLVAAGVALSAIGAVLGVVLSPLGLLVAGVAALGAAFATNFGGLRDVVEPVLHQIRQWIEGEALPALQRLENWVVTEGLPAVVAFIETSAFPALENFIQLLANVWEQVRPALEALGRWFAEEALPTVIGFVRDQALPALEDFFRLISGAWDLISPALLSIADWFLRETLPAIGQAINDVRGFVERLIEALAGVWNSVSGPVSALRDGLLGALGPVRDIIQQINAGLEALSGGGLNTVRNRSAQMLANVSVEEAWQRTLAATGGNDLLARIAFSMMGNPGARAEGGPVAAHHPYIVGERGPELFVPTRDGVILPNEALAGVQIGSVIVHANTPDDGRRAADAFVKRLDQLMTASGASL